MEQENKHRPFGVTILQYYIIAGIAFLANGVTAALIQLHFYRLLIQVRHY